MVQRLSQVKSEWPVSKRASYNVRRWRELDGLEGVYLFLEENCDEDKTNEILILEMSTKNI